MSSQRKILIQRECLSSDALCFLYPCLSPLTLKAQSNAGRRGWPKSMYPLNSIAGIPASRSQGSPPLCTARPWLWGLWCRCSPQSSSIAPTMPLRGASAGGCKKTALAGGHAGGLGQKATSTLPPPLLGVWSWSHTFSMMMGL